MDRLDAIKIFMRGGGEWTKEGKVLAVYDRGTLVFVTQGGQWKTVSAHFSAMPQAL